MIPLELSQWTCGVIQDGHELILGSPPQSFWAQNARQPWSLSSSGDGNKILRFEVRPGDHWANDVPGVERSEVAGATHYPLGRNIHVSYDFMIEPGAANRAKWLVIGQFHQDGAIWSPPFEIGLTGDKMDIVIAAAGEAAIRWSAYKTLWTDSADLVRGRTYHMQINARFDLTGGHLDVTRDGVRLVNYDGPLGWSGMRSVYWKLGVYRAASQTAIAARYSDLSVTEGAIAPAAAPAGISSGQRQKQRPR